MDGGYYVCKLPAEKQKLHHHTPHTEYYGVHFKGENGTYHLANIIKKELPKIGIAASNHKESGEAVVAGVPSRHDLLKSRRFLTDRHLHLLLDNLIYHYSDFEALSTEELKDAGLENLIERSTQ